MTKYLVMTRLGLSKTAIACYENLFQKGGATATQLAVRLGLPRTGLYRLLEQLEVKGFVVSVKSDIGPTYFFSEPLNRAMERLAKYQRGLVADLIKHQRQVLAKRSGSTRE